MVQIKQQSPHPLLKKIKSLTTNIGIYQHGNLDKPDQKFGYALEDQARALIVCHELKENKLEEIYLDFIIRAQDKDVYFKQYYFEDRGFEDDITPLTVLDREEAYGITLWGLFSTKNHNRKELNQTVENLIRKTKNWIYPRAIAAVLLGLTSLDSPIPNEEILAEKLKNYYLKTASPEWQWFENYLVYANAILPWACWEIYLKRRDKEAKKIAKNTTDFLIETCQVNGIPAPVGNKGWFKRGEKKALYDQQPIDAAYMVCCLEKAFEATEDQKYFDWCEKWWKWFWGNNTKNLSLVDKDLGCYDGLTETGVNLNQGAESNICFVMAALAAMRLNLWKLE